MNEDVAPAITYPFKGRQGVNLKVGGSPSLTGAICRGQEALHGQKLSYMRGSLSRYLTTQKISANAIET